MQGQRSTSNISISPETIEPTAINPESSYEQQFLDTAPSNPYRTSFSSYSIVPGGSDLLDLRIKETADDQTPGSLSSQKDVQTQDKGDFRDFSSNVEQGLHHTRPKELAKAIRGRRNLIFLRNQNELELRNYGASRLHHSDKREELLSYGDQMKAELEQLQGINGEVFNKFAALLQSLHENNATLRIQEKTLETREKTLSVQGMKMIRLDNRLMGLEKKALEGDDNSFEEESNSIDVRQSEDIEEVDTLSAHSHSSESHPAADRYYDKVGDMILAKEHIHNLDADYRSNLYLRKSRRELGIPLEDTDSSVYRVYLEQRLVLMNDFTEAKTEADAAWTECQQLDITMDKADIPDLQPPEPFFDQAHLNASTFRTPGWIAQGGKGVDSPGITKSRVDEWVTETKLGPLEDFTEYQSPFNADPLEIQPVKGSSQNEPVGFLLSSRPPSETDIEQDRQTRTFIGEKPLRRYSDPEYTSAKRTAHDVGVHAGNERSFPSTGVVFGAL